MLLGAAPAVAVLAESHPRAPELLGMLGTLAVPVVEPYPIRIGGERVYFIDAERLTAEQQRHFLHWFMRRLSVDAPGGRRCAGVVSCPQLPLLADGVTVLVNDGGYCG